MDDAVWSHTVFSKNRDRLLTSEVAQQFFAEVNKQARRFMSDEHFTVDGTLIQAWASQKSFRKKDGSDGDGTNFHGQQRTNETQGGVTRPSSEQVDALAGATRYPTSFFFEQDRIFGFNASVFFHRKRTDMPAKVLKRVHAVLNLTRMRLDKLMLAGNLMPAIELVRLSVDEHDTPEEIAGKVRALLQLPDGPIQNLTASLEEAGVIVAQHEFNSRRMDAVSEWVPGHPPIVLMNTDDHVPGDRYRWTLAHELGHLIMHTHPIDDMEEQANRFAAEFLLPARDIRPKLRVVRLQTLALLKSIWKVSMGALLERAKQLGTITATQYKYMRINFSKHGYGTQEPPELAISVEIPTLLQDLVKLHTKDLGYSLSDLSALLKMDGKHPVLTGCTWCCSAVMMFGWLMLK